MKHVLMSILAVLMLAVASTAQFSVNGTEIVDSSGDAVDADQDIGTNTGADIVLKNEFGADVTMEVRKSNGTVVATVGVIANSSLTVEVTLDAGTYDIFMYEAGQPSTAEDSGDLVVL